jgi:hypothetical protein
VKFRSSQEQEEPTRLFLGYSGEPSDKCHRPLKSHSPQKQGLVQDSFMIRYSFMERLNEIP